MNKSTRILVPLTLVLLLGLALVLPSQGRPSGFVINNADNTAEYGFQPSSGLVTMLNQVRPRLAIEFANGTQYHSLQPAPAALAILMSAARPKISIEFANANATLPLQSVPAALNTLLANIAPKITVEFANANSEFSFSYPFALIDDNIRPIVSDVSGETKDSGRFAITWKTNEFADSQVEIGTSSGNYTIQASNPLYVKDHALYPAGLQPGVKYYFKVTSTDRSGNKTSSQEYTVTFSEKQELFLPIILAK